MNRWRPIEIFALYLLAAASCTDTHREAGSGGVGGAAAGRGGTSGRTSAGVGGTPAGRGGTSGSASAGVGGQTEPIAGAAGSGGRPQIGDECTAGKPAPTTPDPNHRVCAGGYVDWDGCKARFEGVACYVAELKDGRPDCLPDSDPSVVGRLGEYVFSSGFGAEFVIESAPDVSLPGSCEGAIACCNQQAERFYQVACLDVLDHPNHGSPDQFCPAFGTLQTRLANDETWGKLCPMLTSDAGLASEEDAGTAVPTQHGLCCYRACGHGLAT
jgi:hypothetical protein